jgi:flagellar M-ring protein FliF
VFERLRSLSARQQVTLVSLGVVVVCIALVSVWALFFQVRYEPLFTSLRPTDAAAIAADLDRKKIAYRLADGGATILVPAELVDRTRLSVMTEDIPLKGAVGFELFDRSDMGLTDFAQKINYQRALQGELERTISTLDGVDSARVHLSLGEDRIFRDDQVPPKASVTIRMRRGLMLPASAAQGIQRLIAAAVPSLDAANVVILDEQGRVVGGPPAPRAESAALSPADEERRAIEQYYQARARQALDRAYPLAGLTVAVSASAFTPPAGSNATDWSPAARSFPLAATVTSSGAIDDTTRNSAKTLVEGAIGADASKGDTVDVRMQAYERPAVEPLPVRVARRAEPNEAAPSPDGTTPLILSVLLFALFAGILASAFWYLLRPKRLPEANRAELAAKFRELLGDGERDVA